MDKGDSCADDGTRFAPVTTGRNATHYNMNHKNRGMALVFNYESFEVPETDLEIRNGTHFDADSIAKTLHDLDFDVTEYQDLEYARLKEVIDKAAAFDHTDYDCFVVIVLTHGAKNNILYCYDQGYDFEDLWTPFSANLCPSLAGKPKIFVVQACRGDKYMPPVSLDITETDGLSDNNISRYNIPSKADFLFAFATIPGYSSWRNPNYGHGSWFIEALCKELKENAYKFDILTILTFVSRRVATDYESYCPELPSKHRQKQIPTIESRLTRILQFNRKCENSSNAVGKVTPWQRDQNIKSLNQSLLQVCFELERREIDLQERELQFEMQKIKFILYQNFNGESS